MMKRYHLAVCCFLACALLSGCAATVAQPPLQTDHTPLASAVPISQAQAGIVFSDAAMDAEQDTAAAALLAQGILTPEDDLTQPVTRAQFIRFLAEALELPVTPPKQNGVLQETVYAPYVQAGYAAGLFAGIQTDLSFTPTDGFFMASRGYSEMEQPINRYDVALLLAKLLRGTGQQQTFSDQDWLLQKSDAVQQAVFLTAEKKILTACDDGAFHGDGAMTVGQTAVVLRRLLNCGAALPETTKAAPLSAIESLQKTKRVIHAAGRYLCDDGTSRTYTNSAEALVSVYRAGQRVIELDITKTSDGHLACIHDWLHEFAPNIKDGVPLSLSEWMNTRVKKVLTPLCAESLAGFLREHPDLYIVTDMKDGASAAIEELSRTCPDIKNQFIIQIYQEQEYDVVRSCGFQNIIFTLYNLDKDKKLDFSRLAAFAESHPLVGYTYPLSYFQQDGYNEGMASTGVPLFVHTVNGQEAQEACYAAGITAVYTDDVN